MLGEDAEIHSGYGATEAMPVSAIGSKEILSDTRYLSEQGKGTCVGLPLEGITVRLIRITDEPIEEWSPDLLVQQGEIGEIVVSGELVTRQYFEREEADALSKIRKDGDILHRMGDLGWMDGSGRLWFCGRKNHRVETQAGPLYTIPCEAIFNNHPAVFRSALVGVGKALSQKPVICIELEKEHGTDDRKGLVDELLALAGTSKLTQTIDWVLFHEAFPVDIRHNSKIFREKLAIWAESSLKKGVGNG